MLPHVSSVPKAAQDDAEQISCRVHVVNNTGSPDSNTWGHVRSSLKVLAAADIKDVSVIVQVQHPDVAALEVSLTLLSDGVWRGVGRGGGGSGLSVFRTCVDRCWHVRQEIRLCCLMHGSLATGLAL